MFNAARRDDLWCSMGRYIVMTYTLHYYNPLVRRGLLLYTATRTRNLLSVHCTSHHALLRKPRSDRHVATLQRSRSHASTRCRFPRNSSSRRTPSPLKERRNESIRKRKSPRSNNKASNHFKALSEAELANSNKQLSIEPDVKSDLPRGTLRSSMQEATDVPRSSSR
jgi:hypothetical protein